MPSKQPPPIQFRDETLELELELRTAPGESRNLTAARDLARYYEILKRDTPRFSEPEANLIMDACNGWHIEPHSIPLLPAQIQEAIRFDNLAEKWGVDGLALVKRLEALTVAQKAAVCDAVERAWRIVVAEEDTDPERALWRVGLVQRGGDGATT